MNKFLDYIKYIFLTFCDYHIAYKPIIGRWYTRVFWVKPGVTMTLHDVSTVKIKDFNPNVVLGRYK